MTVAEAIAGMRRYLSSQPTVAEENARLRGLAGHGQEFQRLPDRDPAKPYLLRAAASDLLWAYREGRDIGPYMLTLAEELDEQA